VPYSRPEIFVPLRQTLFLETARSYSEQNQKNRVSVSFQYSTFGPEPVCQHLVRWSIVIVDNSIVGQKCKPFSMQSFT
jgi:hypothetical protein